MTCLGGEISPGLVAYLAQCHLTHLSFPAQLQSCLLREGQIYVNRLDQGFRKHEVDRLIRQKISCSVLEGTAKFNNTNLLTSPFLKKKKENCKLPSVMQWQCCDSQHIVYFMLKESKSRAFLFLVCQACCKKNKYISQASVVKSHCSDSSQTMSNMRGETLCSSPPYPEL